MKIIDLIVHQWCIYVNGAWEIRNSIAAQCKFSALANSGPLNGTHLASSQKLKKQMVARSVAEGLRELGSSSRDS